MAALDALSIGILLGALLVLAGIMSSLVAMRFGAPLLLDVAPRWAQSLGASSGVTGVLAASD